MSLKFGRKPAVHNQRTMRSALAWARRLDPLGPPPAKSNDYAAAVETLTGGDWGMLGNDVAGDCTCADSCHQIMLHTANSGKMVVPSARDALAAYSAITGYDPADPSTDGGANELEVCAWMQRTGILGHRSVGYGSIDPRNFDHIRWCVQIFGCCRLGIEVTQSAMDQFRAGRPWIDSGDRAVVGGHDVPVVGYDEGAFYVVTWGKLQPVMTGFLAAYLEEAHQELYPDWVREQGTAPSGLDLAGLEADLRAVE